jgi:hypothetical protein
MSTANESMPYELSGQDLAALGVWLQLHPLPGSVESMKRRLLAIGSVMTALLAAATYGIWRRAADDREMAIVLGALAGFITFFLLVVIEEARPLLPWGRAAREARLAEAHQHQLALPVNRWRRGPRRLSVTPEGVVEVSGASCLQYDWSVVWAIARLPDHVLFLLSSEGGLVVPRRGFHSDEHFHEFGALAEQYRQQALTATAGLSGGPSVGVTRTQG